MMRARYSSSQSDEYHSYVLRVRAHRGGARSAETPGLSIRVEHVNKRKVMHFNELFDALDFIANSVRREVLRAPN
jgi:hypothetical protein